MAQTIINYNPGFSYNGTGSSEYIGSFTNPSSTEKCEISSLSLYLGSIDGTCHWPGGTTSSGNGGSFNTYVTVGGRKSNTQTVNNSVGIRYLSQGNLPQLNDTKLYTFTFSPAVSINAGSSVSIYLQTPSSGNNRTMAYNYKSGITINYTIIPNIKPAPTSVTIRCTDYDSTSITWSVSVNGTATNYEVYIDNVRKSTSTSGTFSGVSSSYHNIYARAKNGNSAWVDSKVVTVDCTKPPINSAKIDVTTSSQGILNFNSQSSNDRNKYNVQYYLNNAYLGTLSAGDTPNKSVTLTNNSLSNYTLLVKRTDNTKITNSVTLKNIDTRKASLNLTLNAEGMNVNYKCTANMICKSWQFIVYTQQNNTIVRTGMINAGTTTSVSSELSDLQVNTPYYLQVTAITNSSNLLTESNRVAFELKGVSRIWDGNSWRAGVVYVYDGKKWQQVIPYIYDGNEWVVCV